MKVTQKFVKMGAVEQESLERRRQRPGEGSLPWQWRCRGREELMCKHMVSLGFKINKVSRL